jgi:uncharacterized protein (TIGR02453 family)
MASNAADVSEFTGFVPETLKFLKALGFHQSKDWYDAHRDLRLSALLQPMQAYVVALSAACAARRVPLRGDPARAIFRLHRDVRFSKDKRPYKTNAGCVLTRTGLKGSPGLLYTHIAPDGCFLAAGFYHLEPEGLLAMRRAMAGDATRFLAMEKKLAAVGLDMTDDEALTRNPRDFQDVDPRVAPAIRLRNFIVRKPLSEKLIFNGPELVRIAADFARDARPLLDYGWKALG